MGLVRLQRAGPLARVVLERPEQRNAVSFAMLAELGAVLTQLATDEEARVVVLSGEGPDFCAGADFAELSEARASSSGLQYGGAFEEVLRAIATHPVPVIAQVQGAALGAGCQLTVACDLAVAAEDARLGIPSARLGIVINYENVERLVLAVGPKRAGEILFTGRVVSGTEAAQWGLINRAVPAEDLTARTEELALTVAEAAPLAVRGSKRGIAVVLEGLSLNRFSEGHRVADFEMMAAEAFASDDLAEGIRAFRERRKPRFEGR